MHNIPTSWSYKLNSGVEKINSSSSRFIVLNVKCMLAIGQPWRNKLSSFFPNFITTSYLTHTLHHPFHWGRRHFSRVYLSLISLFYNVRSYLLDLLSSATTTVEWVESVFPQIIINIFHSISQQKPEIHFQANVHRRVHSYLFIQVERQQSSQLNLRTQSVCYDQQQKSKLYDVRIYSG